MPPKPSPYQDFIQEALTEKRSVIEYLQELLPWYWHDTYIAATARQTNITIIDRGTFRYIFDDIQMLENKGEVEWRIDSESRLVAVIGVSKPQSSQRDDSRLQGYVGRTETVFGKEWDKGHFIAHSIGGAVDTWECNVFQQLRSVNRGGYRQMERYCAANPGVLCFSRPLYGDLTALPLQVEFGVLKTDGELWVQTFENRPILPEL